MRKLKEEDKHINKFIVRHINKKEALKNLKEYLESNILHNFDISNLDLLTRVEKKYKKLNNTI